MGAIILRMQVFYRTSEPIKVGSEYYQLVCRESEAGFEVGVYHGELKSLEKAASPNDPYKVSFSSDVAEYYLLQSQQEAEKSFREYCDDTLKEGFQHYAPELHNPV